MTELTQDQRDTLVRAQGREGETTPKQWRVSPHRLYDYFGEKHSIVIEVHNATQDDTTLISDAPNLDDLCRAQARIITEQAARIAELEGANNGLRWALEHATAQNKTGSQHESTLKAVADFIEKRIKAKDHEPT